VFLAGLARAVMAAEADILILIGYGCGHRVLAEDPPLPYGFIERILITYTRVQQGDQPLGLIRIRRSLEPWFSLTRLPTSRWDLIYTEQKEQKIMAGAKG
jgi:hypothetical protein